MYIDLKLMGESWDKKKFNLIFLSDTLISLYYDFVQIRYKLILLKEFNHFFGTWCFYPKGGQHVIKSATWTLIKENILVEKQIHCSFLTDWIYFANHGWNFCTVNNFNSIKSLICPTLYDHDSLHFLFESKRRLQQ